MWGQSQGGEAEKVVCVHEHFVGAALLRGGSSGGRHPPWDKQAWIRPFAVLFLYLTVIFTCSPSMPRLQGLVPSEDSAESLLPRIVLLKTYPSRTLLKHRPFSSHALLHYLSLGSTLLECVSLGSGGRGPCLDRRRTLPLHIRRT